MVKKCETKFVQRSSNFNFRKKKEKKEK